MQTRFEFLERFLGDAHAFLIGLIQQFDDGVKEQHFIRADMFATRDEAEACALRKGQQIIDEQGDRLFKE